VVVGEDPASRLYVDSEHKAAGAPRTDGGRSDPAIIAP
jgi:hypothetical protein